ncbi:hypothetical protein, partial [Enterobacter cloacae]|uniref:hypothetical protein n=1 Tax=Enterobacter cloacae TaxID=550 RepID=UPI0031DD8744
GAEECLTLIESINVNKRTLSSSIVSNRNRRQWLDAYQESLPNLGDPLSLAQLIRLHLYREHEEGKKRSVRV